MYTLTSFSSSIFHSFPCFANSLRLISVRLRLISSYVANWIDPFETPTKASRDPLYSPLIPSARYIVRSPSSPFSESFVTEFEDLPQRPRNALGSFLPVANTLVFTTHIGFVSIAVMAPDRQLDRISLDIDVLFHSLASAAASRCCPLDVR